MKSVHRNRLTNDVFSASCSEVFGNKSHIRQIYRISLLENIYILKISTESYQIIKKDA